MFKGKADGSVQCGVIDFDEIGVDGRYLFAQAEHKKTAQDLGSGTPLQWAGTDDDDSRRVSRVEEAGKLQHQPIPALDPYIGYSNPVSLVPVR